MDAAAWDARYEGAELVWSAEPNRFVAEHLADLAPGRALDVACGEGRNAVWLAGRGFAVTGVDFSTVALAKAHQLADASRVTVDWEPGDVTESLPDGHFDVIVVAYLHLPGDAMAGLVARAAAALAPAGTLLLVGHHVDNPGEGYGGPQDVAVLHDHRVLAGLFADDAAYSVETAARVERPVTTDDGEVVALDALVRVVRIALD